MARLIGGTLATHREATTSRIFDALRALLYERGYDAITLAEVARAAGLARTAIYNYFPDKESLLVAYAGRETDEFLEQLDAELRTIDNPVNQLQAYVRMQLAYFAGNHLPPGATLRLLLPEPAASAVLAHVELVEERLRQILRTGRDRRFLAFEDLDATVAMVSACISRGSDVRSGSGGLAAAEAATSEFILRAVGAQLGPDGRPRRHSRR